MKFHETLFSGSQVVIFGHGEDNRYIFATSTVDTPNRKNETEFKFE
jgi:hypothetical protein